MALRVWEAPGGPPLRPTFACGPGPRAVAAPFIGLVAGPCGHVPVRGRRLAGEALPLRLPACPEATLQRSVVTLEALWRAPAPEG
ncbi:hypothetical protein GCM10020001_072480 [Nonomuraea salmonea]